MRRGTWHTVVIAVLAAALAAPAAGATPGAVVVPAHEREEIGPLEAVAGDTGMALRGDVATLVGPPGDLRRATFPHGLWSAPVGDLMAVYSDEGGATVVHRVDLRTGEVLDATTVESMPLAFTGTGVVLLRDPPGVDVSSMVEQPLAGGEPRVLVDDVLPDLLEDGSPRAGADAHGVWIRYTAPAAGGPRQRLVHVTRTGPRVVTTLDTGRHLDIVHVALAPTDIAWVTHDDDFRPSLHRHGRAPGGGTTTSALPPMIRDVAATDTSTAYTVGMEGRLDVLPEGASPVTVPLPSTAGLESFELQPWSDGTRYRVAVGGPPSTAGIFDVDDSGHAERVAPLPPEPARVTALALSAGLLSYTDDRARPDPVTTRVWRRAVTGEATLALGAEQRLPATVAQGYPALAFSGGRGAAPALPGNIALLLDRGQVTATVPAQLSVLPRLLASGPWFVTADQARNHAGRALGRIVPSTQPSDAALFGSRLISVTTSGVVRMRDLARPGSRWQALTDLCPPGTGTCFPEVSTWGSWIGWSFRSRITLRNLATGEVRVVDTGDRVRSFQLGDGVAAWWSWDDRIGGTVATRVLDLTDPGSSVLQLDERLREVVLDGHRLAGVDGEDRVVVVPLPFGGDQRPRHLGTVAPASVRRGSAWSPAFDATKPMSRVTLTITRGGRRIRTLTGTAPDGSVRDLRWHTRAVPEGTYTWRLTGTATDGEGPLVGGDGHSPVTGTVRVTG